MGQGKDYIPHSLGYCYCLAFMIMNLKVNTNYGNSVIGLPCMKHYFNWFKVPLYKVLFGLKETYILTELQGILLIPECNLFRLRKTSPLAKPRANLFQITKTGTVSQDG